MDKYEYKVRADEVKSLIAAGEYTEAVKIADAIDWRRVKSVMMLCTISDLYKINRRYEDSRDILLLAYEKHTGGRLIVYSLCELSLKLEDLVQAIEYYKEFVQLAPKDTSRFILQYKIYEAQDVSLEERIAVLEEFKKKDYREKWAYELAYMYHRVGLASKCVEECNEMSLWFGEGRHVLKALELKMLHEPLTQEQQEKFKLLQMEREGVEPEFISEQRNIREEASVETEDEEDDEFSIHENMLAEPAGHLPSKEMDIQVKPVDVSQYNTVNLQKELAENMREFLDGHQAAEAQEEKPFHNDKVINFAKQYTEEMVQISEPQIKKSQKDFEKQPVSEEVFFGNTSEVNIEEVVSELVQKNSEKSEVNTVSEVSVNSAISNTGIIRTFNKPSGYDDILSQEYDGQISLVVPEAEMIEKQITGQLSIDDVMAEWERMKQANERRRMEEIKKRVQKQTGTLFSDFDESTKTGLLEELEKAMVAAAIKEEKIKIVKDTPKVIKVSDIEILEKKKQTESIAEEEPEEVLGEDETEEELDEVMEEPEKSTDKTVKENVEKADEESGSDAEATEAVPEENGENSDNKNASREMSTTEREQFAPFIHHRKTRKQIVDAIDNLSMASYTGNVVITGEEGTGNTALAKLLVKEIQLADNNFSGKVAKISAAVLNKKDVGQTLAKLSDGALIIEKATQLKKQTVERILKELNQEESGWIILLEDTKPQMNGFLEKYPELLKVFNLRVDVEALDDQTLVKYARKYAFEQEYAIDDLGVLALHTRIADMQTADHEVSLAEIEELVDEAIYYADRKTPKHFFDVLFGKRYDEEDMIVLREKDFMHD